MMRIEIQRLHALESAMVPHLERLAAKASTSRARNRLDEMLSASTVRIGRLEQICSLAGWICDGGRPHVLDGWRRDVDELVMNQPDGIVTDAMLMGFIQKLIRMKTSCYEVAGILASGLDAGELAKILRQLWADDKESDEQTANIIVGMIVADESPWEEGFRLR